MDPGPSSSSGPSKRPLKYHGIVHSEQALDRQAGSIAQSTSLSGSLAQSLPPSLKDAKAPKRLGQIKDKRLRAQVTKEHLSQRRSVESAKLANEYLHAVQDAGLIETEGDLERTHRVTQSQIKDSVGIDAARKGFELRLDGGKAGVGLGPYRCDYTHNGRHLLLGGRKGHLASFDWQTGKLACEIQVRETVRDVKWLHNNNFFAVAQKKYTFIYDGQGIEIHKLKNHAEVNRMEFLPYHFLLATVGQAGYLKYQDTSTGKLVSQHRSGLGACQTMSQNPLTAVMQLGHANGTVTMWTPNLSTPAVKLLAHRGPVTGVSIDTRNGGHEMATSGLDGSIKVWDSRMLGRGPRREWISRKPASDIAYSQRGLLGVAWGSHVSVYNTSAPLGNAPPGPYITNNFPRSEPLQVNFCPFEDILGVSHTGGFTSLLVPGAGEPNFDSREADPFETKGARREREVHSLLDKIQPELITLDPDVIGSLAQKKDNTAAAEKDAKRSFAQMSRLEKLQVNGMEEDGVESDDQVDVMNGQGPAKVALGKPVKKKMRGRNSAMKKYLAKKKKNVVDPNTLAIKAKLERIRAEEKSAKVDPTGPKSALDMFKK